MALTYGVAQTTTPASGTFDLTSAKLGSTGKGGILVFSSCAAKDTRKANVNYSIGLFDGTNQVSATGFVYDAQTGDSRGAWSFVNTRAGEINTPGITWSVGKSFDVNSLITNGVRLEVQDGAGTGFYVNGLLIGGTGNVHVGTLVMNAQDVATSYASCPFQPTGMVVLYAVRSINTNGATNPIISLGGFDGTNQKSQMWYSQDGVYIPTTGVSCFSTQRSNRAATYGTSHCVEVTSFNADGFTAYSRDGNAVTIAFLLIDGPMHVGNSTYATSGTEQYSGGTGTPLAAIEIPTLITGALDTNHGDSQADGWGISLYDDTNAYSLWCKDDDGATAASDAGMYLHDGVVDIWNGDDSQEARAAFSSFTSTGRILTPSDYPAAALRYLTIQFLSEGGALPAIWRFRKSRGDV